MKGPEHAADPQQDFECFADFYQNSAYSAYPQEHGRAGSILKCALAADQEAIDFIHPPFGEFIFFHFSDGRPRLGMDVGFGYQEFSDYGPGHLAVAPPNESTRHFAAGPHQIRVFTIEDRVLFDLLERSDACVDPIERCFGQVVEDVRLAPLIESLWRSVSSSYAGNSLYTDGLSLQLLALLTSDNALSPLAHDKIEDARIVRVLDYIETHFGEQLSIADLASVACLSPGHFSRTFKVTVGEPVWSYVTRRRCERAKDMLVKTRLSLAEIAYACGFSHQGHMTRAFGQHFGVSPGVVRKSQF